MKGQKRGGEFQADRWRAENDPIREASFEGNTHSQRLKGHVYPSDGVRTCGVITGKVWNDTPRGGCYDAGGGELDGRVLGQPGKSQSAQPRRKGGG